MNQSVDTWKDKIERYTKETTRFIDKWVDHLDEKGTELKDKWIEQSQTIEKQNRLLESLKKKEQLNQKTIQTLQEKLKARESNTSQQRTNDLSKALKEKNEVVGKLLRHVQAQQKQLDEKNIAVQRLEDTLQESEKAISETQYRLSQSKAMLKELQEERLKVQKEQQRTTKLLQTYKEKLEEAASENTVRHYEHLIKTLTDQLFQVTERTEEIDREMDQESNKNQKFEELLVQEKARASQYLQDIEIMKRDYEKVVSEREQLYGLLTKYKDEMNTYMTQLEDERQATSLQRAEMEELENWLNEEWNERERLQVEYEKLITQRTDTFFEREATTSELKKKMDLEQRMERGFDKVFQYVKLSNTFYKDYRQLKDPSERMSLEVGLIEMEIAYRMGKPKYRRNVVKTKDQNYYECEWGFSIGLPGRIYVRNEGSGCVVERISRVKHGGSKLSQDRVIDWLKNQ
ncbi:MULTISPECIES: hypothetical protein [unclassified Exiguobacterium]|uniref:hypothetical protein n=1 Tax=unclassified Exiguobacterium TaxID=2644629 RepID=UPI00103D0EDE|nr:MULTISPECIES: hypothetical protein [unclassified Exiguobacterium]TCI48027.1 hypothetical protein EVJ31_03040 [Exiguobacterium sp. SH5S32]TCI54911.1 hypothetical protein EVJ25_03035 [Exiguobacterium sp. SH1S4]TCI74707.1 hypothetical protein EVJ23_03035 [Exiguobacterium sp. SH1S1]